MTINRIHGGTDALGVPRYDFSTNSNACGPCPAALRAVTAADARHYPDAAYTELRAQLAAFHGVSTWRVVPAGSASEFIFRISAWVARRGEGAPGVHVPLHAYGDYLQAARAWGLQPVARVPDAALVWACEPASPLGQAHSGWPQWLMPDGDPPTGPSGGGAVQTDALRGLLPRPLGEGGGEGCLGHRSLNIHPHPHPHPNPLPEGEGINPHGINPHHVESSPSQTVVLDSAYAPLRLAGHASLSPAQCNQVWQLFSPNKALGLAGVRGAYAIAPLQAQAMLPDLAALAASWPLGVHGVAMLQAWVSPEVQAWLGHSLHTLRDWKARQIDLLQSLGWRVLPSEANFFCAQPPVLPDLVELRQTHGIKLRDASSFGLPGWYRLGVLGPQAQHALGAALCGQPVLNN